MEIPDHLLKGIVRHAIKVIDGYDKPYDYRVAESARLLKKEAEKLNRILIKDNAPSKQQTSKEEQGGR